MGDPGSVSSGPAEASSEWAGLPPVVLGLSEWPTHVEETLWRQFFGRPPRGIVVLIDEQLGQSHGQLRALPLLRALGVTRFTFAHGWRGLALVPFEWCRVAEDTSGEDLEGVFPICQFVPQSMEDVSTGDAAYMLLRAQRRAPGDPLLVYVFDTPRFARRRGPQAKPFVDEYEISCVASYSALARAYASLVHLALGQPMLSLNLAWHGLAAFQRGHDPVRHLEDVLNIDRHCDDSPIWGLYEHFCEMAGVEADADKVRKGLRSWLDREITRSSDQVVLWLQRFSFNDELVRGRQVRKARNGG